MICFLWDSLDHLRFPLSYQDVESRCQTCLSTRIAFHSSPFILKVGLPHKHPTVAPAGSWSYFYISFLTGASLSSRLLLKKALIRLPRGFLKYLLSDHVCKIKRNFPLTTCFLNKLNKIKFQGNSCHT